MATRAKRSSFIPPNEIFAALAKDRPHPLYLFHGDEPYFIDRAVKIIVSRFGARAEQRTFYAGEDSIDELMDSWSTDSLFADKLVIVLKNATLLSPSDRERLAAESQFRDSSRPLVVCALGKVSLAQRFFLTCRKMGFVGEFRKPFHAHMKGWAQRVAKEKGFRLQGEAAALLADQMGTNLLALSTEIDKIGAYVVPSKDIGPDDVKAAADDLTAYTVFDLADALGNRNASRALAIAQNVHSAKNSAIGMLHAFVSHIRRIWRVKEMTAENVSRERIETAIGARGQRASSLIRQSQNFSFSELAGIIRAALDLDVSLKSKATPPRLLFDEFLLRVCQGQGAVGR